MAETADTATVLAALPLGLAIGLVVGTVGGGGAILALPALVYVLGEPVGAATTASLIVVAVAATFGIGAASRHESVCWRIVASFSVPAALGAALGTLAGQDASAKLLTLAFVPVMFVAAAMTAVRGAAADGEDEAGCPPVRPAASALLGLAVGALTGFFGVGGGFMIVPVLSIALGLSMTRATASSLAIIALTGAVALATHLAQGAEPDWPLTIVLALATAGGAIAGAGFARRLPERALAFGFAGLVAALAIFLLVDVLALGGPPV